MLQGRTELALINSQIDAINEELAKVPFTERKATHWNNQLEVLMARRERIWNGMERARHKKATAKLHRQIQRHVHAVVTAALAA